MTSVTTLIEIVPYDVRWPEEFRRVGIAVREALGDVAVRIDHIGSTAVPGLAAKDVIDIQVTVERLDREWIVATFTALGYTHPERISRDHVPQDGPAGPRNGRSCCSVVRSASAASTCMSGRSAVRINAMPSCFATTCAQTHR
jgi:GrpB-like predicted nucleotidyltransferase (UPF0157 family)